MIEPIDEKEVRKWWGLMKGDGKLTEVRILGENKVFSGYFRDIETLISQLRSYSRYNCFFTINSIIDTCDGREQYNKIIMKPKSTTTDMEIVGRDFVFLDLDVRKVSGVNASDEEIVYVKKKANEVNKFLIDNGFNKPLIFFSANGVHFYLKCALANNQYNNELIHRFTLAMSMLFSDDHVEIDEKIFNLARIAKIPGTYSRKGTSSSKTRPQRKAYIVKYPDEIKNNDKEYFEKIAKLYPEPEKPSFSNNFNTEKFDLDAFIAKHNIQISKIEYVAGGKKYILDHCIFNENHRGKDAVIFQKDNGALSYVCLHNSCSDNDWKKFRLHFEPDAYDKRERAEYQFRARGRGLYMPPKPEFVPVEETEDKGNKWLNMSDIKYVDVNSLVSIPTGFDMLDKKIVGLMMGDVSVLSGISGSGKTSLLDCLALNVVQRGYKVAIWSGELQDFRFQSWINQIAAGKSYVKKKDGYDNLYYAPKYVCEKINKWLDGKLFLYNNNYGSRFKQIFKDIHDLVEKQNIQLVILDNLMALQITDYEGDKYSQQTAFINELKEYAKKKNIHIIIVCHPRKDNGFLRKEGVSGTADLVNLADNLFFTHRVGKDFEVRAGEFFGKDKVIEYLKYSVVVEVAKNRSVGVVDLLVGLYYENESRRLKNDIAEHINYGWQEEPIPAPMSFNGYMPESSGLPFEPSIENEILPF